jgi:ABC-type nitrate/sulfonate/bicarbonate transport system ATPase subunit
LNSILEVKNISKYFNKPDGAKQIILDNMNFTINEGNKITSILAPVGGGKSTLLKIISGLDNDYEGELLFNKTKINQKLPLIPEQPASLPWLDVNSNISIIDSIHNNNEKLSKGKLQELINLTGLTDYEKHFPHNKSYGFRFRIALARTLAVSSPIILLDDPFKLMDLETKKEIFGLIKKIVALKNIKFLFASSNIEEVAILSDKIFLFNYVPCYLFGEIMNEKNMKSVVKIKSEIHELLLKENADNFLFY